MLDVHYVPPQCVCKLGSVQWGKFLYRMTFQNFYFYFLISIYNVRWPLYSEVLNKRPGPDSRPGWKRDQKLIAVQGQINV